MGVRVRRSSTKNYRSDLKDVCVCIARMGDDIWRATRNNQNLSGRTPKTHTGTIEEIVQLKSLFQTELKRRSISELDSALVSAIDVGKFDNTKFGIVLLCCVMNCDIMHKRLINQYFSL